MKRFLIAAAFALVLTTSCAAQVRVEQPQDHTMEALLAARAKLIQRYVQSEKVARGVAVCGETDVLTGEDHSYLCIYVYRDSTKEFLADFVNYATPSGGGNLGVDGIPVAVNLIGPAKATDKIPNVEPKPAVGTAPPSKT
jgi:hypothetical protein